MSRRMLTLAATTLAAVGAALGAGLGLGGWDFLRQHLGPLLLAALLSTLTLTLLVKTAALVIRATRTAVRRPRALGQSGAAFAEFIIVIIPFMLTLTALMQLALASLARVLVSYSAFCAARAAIVLIPVDGNFPSGNPLAQMVKDEGPGRVGYGANTRIDFTMSKKASLIRNAASYPLIPASPSIDIVVEDTINNWGEYAKNRVKAGLSPGEVLVDLIREGVKLPPAMQEAFSEKLQQAVKGGLDTPEQKAAAKARIEIAIQSLPEDQQAEVRKKAYDYIDNYKGTDGSPTDVAGSWAKSTMDDTFQGPLSKFRDIMLAELARKVANSGKPRGGNFHGYTVDRALDVGLAADMDGAGGAILRSLRKLLYARGATVVTLHGPDGKYKTKFAPGEPITAKVTYLYYCQIPIANHFAGRPFYDLPKATQFDMTTGPLGYVGAIGLPGYFMPLTAQHTLINQGRP